MNYTLQQIATARRLARLIATGNSTVIRDAYRVANNTGIAPLVELVRDRIY